MHRPTKRQAQPVYEGLSAVNEGLSAVNTATAGGELLDHLYWPRPLGRAITAAKSTKALEDRTPPTSRCAPGAVAGSPSRPQRHRRLDRSVW